MLNQITVVGEREPFFFFVAIFRGLSVAMKFPPPRNLEARPANTNIRSSNRPSPLTDTLGILDRLRYSTLRLLGFQEYCIFLLHIPVVQLQHKKHEGGVQSLEDDDICLCRRRILRWWYQ